MQESKKVTAWEFWHKIAWNSFIYLQLLHIAALAACLNVMHAGGANVILSKSELAEFMASKIVRYTKPQFVVYVSGLPKTKDGSVDRAKVKAEHGTK